MRALREIPSSNQIHQSWISTLHHLALSNTMGTVSSNYYFLDQPSNTFSALVFSFDISPSSLLVSIIKQQKLNKSFWYFCHIFCDIFSIFLWYFCHIFCNIFVTFFVIFLSHWISTETPTVITVHYLIHLSKWVWCVTTKVNSVILTQITATT